MKNFHSFFRMLAMLIITSRFLALHAFAQWSSDQNINNPICTAVADQDAPRTVSDSAGGAIITWQDHRSSSYDIYAQRINALGVVQWGPNGVAISTAENDQQFPVIVTDGAGGAIITWRDNQTGNWDIYAQRISTSGVVQWHSNGVAICTAPNGQGNPTITSDGAGGAIIAWDDLRNGYWDIYAQRISASGVVQWTDNGIPICTASGSQMYPGVVSDGAGGAIVTWFDLSYKIYTQRINASGAVQWNPNGVAIHTTADYQQRPTIVGDGAGGGIIAWEEMHIGGNWDIRAQRINTSGVVQWEANGVAICTAEGNQYFPTLISNGADAIITWQDWRNGNADVYAQRVNPSGIVQWGSNGAAICTTGSYQEHPSLISDCAGGAIITWQDGISVSISDIFAQRIDASGVVQWGLNGTAVSTADSGQADPDLVSDARGGAIITWLDCRNGDWDIYAQQVSANGNLGEITGVIGPGAPLSVYRLHQNYPNPFNPSTRIKFQIPSTNIVTLKIYDVSGREMITLVNIELKAGSYEATFDATRLASGVYFYRLKAGGFTETKKLLLLR